MIATTAARDARSIDGGDISAGKSVGSIGRIASGIGLLTATMRRQEATVTPHRQATTVTPCRGIRAGSVPRCTVALGAEETSDVVGYDQSDQ
jgi:hypothetical protein